SANSNPGALHGGINSAFRGRNIRTRRLGAPTRFSTPYELVHASPSGCSRAYRHVAEHRQRSAPAFLHHPQEKNAPRPALHARRKRIPVTLRYSFALEVSQGASVRLDP